jgi:flagellar FliJ protein
MSFKFRLQTLMRIREQTRDERRAQLADALRVDVELERQQNELKQELAESRLLAHPTLGSIDVDRVLESQRYEMLLGAKMAALTEQRNHVAKEIEQRRLALVEADREVRVLEKLRETQLERFKAEEQQIDQRRLDEVATIGHYRQQQT